MAANVTNPFKSVNDARNNAFQGRRFNDIEPETQRAIIRQFTDIILQLSGISLRFNLVEIHFRQVNPRTTGGKLSQVDIVPVQNALAQRFKCALASGLAAAACE